MQVVVGQAVNILYYATRLITVTKALRGNFRSYYFVLRFYKQEILKSMVQ